MRTLSNIGFTVVYMLVGVTLIVSQTIPQEKWQRFSSPVAGFSVLLPGDPQESISEPSFSPFYVEGMKSYAVHVGLDEGSFDAVERVYPNPSTNRTSFPPTLTDSNPLPRKGLEQELSVKQTLPSKDYPRAESRCFQH